LRWPDYIGTEHGARMLQNSLFSDQVAKTAKSRLTSAYQPGWQKKD
jgi:hypothetical protein